MKWTPAFAGVTLRRELHVPTYKTEHEYYSCVMRPEPAEPQQTRSRRTRKAILKAALELLATKPFHDVSVTEIVTRAGVSVGAFYSRFASKESLLDALDAQLSDEFHHFLDQAFPDPEEEIPEPITPGFAPGPMEILARYTSANVRFCRTHREPLVQINRHADPTSPARSARWRRLHTISQTRLATRLQQVNPAIPTGLRLHLALFMIRAATRDGVLRDALRECPVAINDDILIREIARSAVAYLVSSP